MTRPYQEGEPARARPLHFGKEEWSHTILPVAGRQGQSETDKEDSNLRQAAKELTFTSSPTSKAYHIL